MNKNENCTVYSYGLYKNNKNVAKKKNVQNDNHILLQYSTRCIIITICIIIIYSI